MFLAQLLDRVHSTVAASNLGLWAAVKLRNQAEGVIAKGMSSGVKGISNGEASLLGQVAHSARVVIDVGANIGGWFELLRARSPGLQRAFLVEPGRNAASRLVERYGADPRVTVVPKAASDYVGSAEFFELDGASELSSLVPDSRLPESRRKSISVAVTTIDQLHEEFALAAVDILKIDAEGVDMKVIRGAQRCLEEKLIALLQFEYNTGWASCGETLEGAINFLNANRYRVFLLKKDGLYDPCHQIIREYFRYSNYVAVPDVSIPIVRPLMRGGILRNC